MMKISTNYCFTLKCFGYQKVLTRFYKLQSDLNLIKTKNVITSFVVKLLLRNKILADANLITFLIYLQPPLTMTTCWSTANTWRTSTVITKNDYGHIEHGHTRLYAGSFFKYQRSRIISVRRITYKTGNKRRSQNQI